MQKQHTKNTLPSNRNAVHGEHDEEVLRFARRLDMHHDLERLLQALPTELGSITVCNTTALVYHDEGTVSWHVANADMRSDATPPLPSIAERQETIFPLGFGHQRKLVMSIFDEATPFPADSKDFPGLGSPSLCGLPLETALHR